MTFHLHHNDLEWDIDFGSSVAVDTEAMGLAINRDRLCVVQLSAGDGTAHLVQFAPGMYDAPRLRKVLGNPKIEKIFHFARFDVAILQKYLGVVAAPLFCTKIASKLARTYTDRHGLKDLCQDLLDVQLNKETRTSCWGQETLTEAQLTYAAQDVLYLHQLKKLLTPLLKREHRWDLAKACFDFIPTVATLDIDLFDPCFILSH